MHILFITDNFPPEVNAPASRTFEHINHWINDENVKVTVITCFPNFPNGKVFDGYKNKLFERSKYQNIEVIRVWSYIAKNRGTLKRILDYFSFAISTSFFGLFLKCDIIVATSPQFFTTWAAWFLSKVKRVPWIFELRDLWPDTISTVSNLKNKNIISFLHTIEIFLYKSANSIVAVTNSFKENLISRGIKHDKIEVVTNGVDLDLFKHQTNKSLIDQLNLKNKFVVGYIGTHGLCHGLEFIVNAIPKIKHPNVHFLFIGEGATKESLIKQSNTLNLNNITFLDMIRKNDVPKYLSICNVSLVPLINDELFKTVIPSKIFEAAAMKTPIFLGVEGESKEIIKKYNAGICYEPESESSFLSQFDIIYNIENYSDFQQGCENLAKDYSRKNLAYNMLEIIKKTNTAFKQK
jgi:glycosyltransferase involved in cell wall biosynthesis|tara:strand:- start:894 stop:2117 length:1224 start_codon:yes stop_codon:yes gene_type:complete